MSKHHATISAEETVALFNLNLKNRALAALLAWLFPGAGHLYQGRTTKGLLFMICLVTTFVFGYTTGNCRVVYAGVEPFTGPVGNTVMTHWKFICQSGVGAVAIPCVIERQRALAGKEPLFGEAFRPPDMSRTRDHNDGSGNPALGSPPLKHASDWYLLSQLKKFKGGVRGTNPMDTNGALMVGMAQTLVDEQAMKDVIAHIMTFTD